MKKHTKILALLALVVLFTFTSNFICAQSTQRLQLESKLIYSKGEDARTEAFLALGEYYMKWHLKKLDSLVNVVQEVSSSYQHLNRSKLALFLADAYAKNSKYQMFIETMNYFQNTNISNLPPKLQAQIHINQGFVSTFTNDRVSAKKKFLKGIKTAKSITDYSDICTALNLMAFEALINNERKKTLQYADEALENAKKSGLDIDLAYCYNTQANIYHFLGENETSIKKNLLALALARKSLNHYETSQFAFEIGEMQESVRNFSGAKYYYEISLKHAKIIHSYSQMAQALTSIGNLLRKEKKYEASQEMNLRALRLINTSGDHIRAGDIEKNMGQNYTDLKLNQQAIEHFLLAIDHYKKGKNEKRIATIDFLLGEVYFEENKLDKSLEYLLESVEIAKTFGNPKAKFKPYLLIAEIYKTKNKKDLALRYMSDYIKYLGEEKAAEANQKIAQLGETNRTEERDRMIAEQSEKLEKQQQIRKLTEAELENATLRSRLQTYFIIAFLILIVLATIIGTYRSRQAATQRKRKQAEMSQTLLRSQMNPHFIFNAMSVIQSYIYDNDVENSSQFLVSFSRLIRLILENSPKEFISIETEIDILNKYLETQKIRFEKRFEFEIICPENLIYEKTLIPPMITQPFVENAIEHGELHQIENGKITIQFSKKDDMLHVEIEDNGIGRKSSEKNKPEAYHKSMATSITEERIRIMNEKENSIGYLSVTDGNILDGTGTKVTISLPFKKEISLNKI